MDGFYTSSQARIGDGDIAMPYYTARELPFYYSLFERLGALRELLLLAARADVAEPLLPDVRHVGRDHDERPLGLRHLRLGDWPIILDLLDDAGVTLEDLLHRLRRRRGRRHRQRRRVLEPLGARPAHARRRSTTTSTTAAAARCRTSPGSSRASRCSSTSIPTRTCRVGMGFQQQIIKALRDVAALGQARRSSSPTTSTAASSTTWRRRRSTRTGSASGCRCGSISPFARRGPIVVARAGRPRLDAEVHRAALGPADARLAEPHVRHLDADRRQLQHGRRAGAAARRARAG